tara:strand:- start:112 stop:432 length:321 start_codon:yes stop_codon:yes gene_type:complete
MGKKRRILRSPKFAHLRRMRKWQTLVEDSPQEQPPVQLTLEKEEQVVETPIFKQAEKELAPRLEQEKPAPTKKAATRKRSTTQKTKVAAKRKPAAKTRARKTTSKK